MAAATIRPSRGAAETRNTRPPKIDDAKLELALRAAAPRLLEHSACLCPSRGRSRALLASALMLTGWPARRAELVEVPLAPASRPAIRGRPRPPPPRLRCANEMLVESPLCAAAALGPPGAVALIVPGAVSWPAPDRRRQREALPAPDRT